MHKYRWQKLAYIYADLYLLSFFKKLENNKRLPMASTSAGIQNSPSGSTCFPDYFCSRQTCFANKSLSSRNIAVPVYKPADYRSITVDL